MANDIYNYDPLGGYQTNPPTQQGSGAYGGVPGAINIPPNLYQQIGEINPEIAAQTGTLNQNILSELMGELSPATKYQIQQNAAQFGAATGMPMSQFAGNQGLLRFGQNVEATQRQGLQDYLAMLRGTGEALTPQQLASEIASRNATMAAAPNPEEAARQQMMDWQNKFNQMTSGGGGTTISPGAGRGAPMGEQLFSAYDSVPTVFSGTGESPYNAALGRERMVNPNTGFYNLPGGSTYGGGGASAGGTPQGSIYMGGATGAPQQAQTPGIYIGGASQGAAPVDYVQQLGFDTSSMTQDDVDMLAYLYGYSPASTGTTGFNNYYDFSNYGPDTYYNPVTDTSNYNYGLPSWDTGGYQVGTYDPSTDYGNLTSYANSPYDFNYYDIPADTYYNPATDQSTYAPDYFDWYDF